ncbi:unnamed protein product [Caenorhabditis brenneri]
MRVTLDEYPRNDFFMEDMINEFSRASLKDQNLEATGSKFLVVTYQNTKAVTVNSKEKTILLFQRPDDVDVLVNVMYAQEYPRLKEKQWLVVDYMDSVAYVEPRKMSGYVFGEVIISYLAYMPRFGYKNVHLFADPSVQNEDYIFRINPAFQVYKESDSSIRYYGSGFA